MLATPTSILIQAPAHAPGILWLAAVAMVIQVVLDIHVQNRSLKFNDVSTVVGNYMVLCLTHHIPGHVPRPGVLCHVPNLQPRWYVHRITIKFRILQH